MASSSSTSRRRCSRLRIGVCAIAVLPMRMSRLKALERAQLLVESTQRGALQAFLAEWMTRLHALKVPAGLRWHLDVDPLEL